MRPCLVLACTLVIISCQGGLGAGVEGRLECPEGYTRWPADLTCHKTYRQGPCGPGQVLTSHPQGPTCVGPERLLGGPGGWGLGHWGLGGQVMEQREELEGDHQELEGGHQELMPKDPRQQEPQDSWSPAHRQVNSPDRSARLVFNLHPPTSTFAPPRLRLGEPASWSFPQEAEEQEKPWSQDTKEEHGAWSLPQDSEEQEDLGPWPDQDTQEEEEPGPWPHEDIQEEEPGSWPHEDIQEEEPGSWALPQDNEELLTAAVQDCLEREQVWWPEDGSCHHLLTQGPCGPDHWLVLQEDRVVCQRRLCPCDPAMPDLCEVEVSLTEDSLADDRYGRCRVATAAAQEGLCSPGEQLLLGPQGRGACGCVTSPPHALWREDGRCYALHSQGPCREGFVFTVSGSRLEAACLPGVCYPGHIHDRASCSEIVGSEGGGCEDLPDHRGSCHRLGTRGPCEEFEVLGLDPDTLEPACVLNTSRIKRVYDIIPSSGGLTKGPIPRPLKMENCRLDSAGKCRKSFFVRRGRSMQEGVSRDRSQEFYIRRRSGREYLRWLRAFKRNRNRRL